MKPTDRALFVTFQKTPPALCPRCRVTLRSATGLDAHRPARPAPGSLTLCDACYTWLAFTDGLGLRLATAAEIETIPDNLRNVAERIATFVNMGIPDRSRH